MFAPFLLAVVCAGQSVLLVADSGPVAIAAAVGMGVAVGLARRLPVVAALAVPALDWVQWWAGVPDDNQATLLPAVIVVYALGRRAPAPAVVALAAYLATFLAHDPSLASGLFGLVLVGGVWSFGVVVRRRAEGARRAVELRRTLAAQDPTARAAQVVAEERSRLAGETLDVIRRAVRSMRALALTASAELDAGRPPAAAAAVAEEGRQAVAELRRLLGLLRAEPAPTAPPVPPRPARRRRRDLITTAAVVGLVVLELVVRPMPTTTAGSAALSVIAPLALVLLSTAPARATLLTAGPPLAALLLGQPLAYGFWSVALWSILAWTVGARATVRALSALVVAGAANLVASHVQAPGNEAITLVCFVLPAIAGYLWADKDRVGRAAEAEAARLRDEHDDVAERAVRAERLRVARELHDVASHAVGVMVLQASAAQACWTADSPGAARTALTQVRLAGEAALAELSTLFGLLEAGAVGVPGVASPAHDADLATALHDLAARIRVAGVRLDLALESVPSAGLPSSTVYRVVQEALTNVVKHAPGSEVRVVVGALGDGWQVSVEDDGTGGAAEPGFGLIGLAERVRAAGGDLTSGARPEGGFAVRARFPVLDGVPV